MIQNLRVVFSHQDMVILTSLFFIVVYLIFPIQKYNKIVAYRIVAACCLWWVILVFIYPPKGFNYNIYKYNASLTISGQKAFDRGDNHQNNEGEITSYTDAKYLDYTGAQHFAYVLLEELNLSRINPKLSGFGFQLWTIFNISIIILFVSYLKDFSNEYIESDKIWPIIFISFLPIIPFYTVIAPWEDKLIFLLIPLLLLFLIKRGKHKIASLIMGLFASYNGATVFFLPVYLIYLFQENKENIWQNILLMFAGFIIALIPYFPESLNGWTNRMIRMDITKPFWYSFYSLLPSGIYSPLLNNIIIIVISLLTMVLFYYKKINIIDALIISISIVIMFSPYNGVSRVIPLILLLAIMTPNMKRINWILLGIFLFIFLAFDNGYITPVVNTENTILFYIPVLFSFGLYIYKRLKYDNINVLMAD